MIGWLLTLLDCTNDVSSSSVRRTGAILGFPPQTLLPTHGIQALTPVWYGSRVLKGFVLSYPMVVV